MWSATWPKEIQALARDFLGESPLRAQIGSTDLAANHRIKQHVYIMNGKDNLLAAHSINFKLQTMIRRKSWSSS